MQRQWFLQPFRETLSRRLIPSLQVTAAGGAVLPGLPHRWAADTPVAVGSATGPARLWVNASRHFPVGATDIVVPEPRSQTPAGQRLAGLPPPSMMTKRP